MACVVIIRFVNFIYAIISVLIAQTAGVIGSIFTVSNVGEWYTTLVTPSFNPPAWVFGPVWTMLYTLMGIAAYLVWRKIDAPGAKPALTLYGVQLALNALWSILFFGLHSPGGALAEIVLLWFAIIATMVAFARVSRLAAWLLAPYILWVSFAAYLNYAIWMLNQ